MARFVLLFRSGQLLSRCIACTPIRLCQSRCIRTRRLLTSILVRALALLRAVVPHVIRLLIFRQTETNHLSGLRRLLRRILRLGLRWILLLIVHRVLRFARVLGIAVIPACLLYTSDAADDSPPV